MRSPCRFAAPARDERFLRPIEVAVLRVEVELRERLAVGGGEALGPLDALDEAVAHPPKRKLGIDVQPPSDVHGCEEDVAELLDEARVRLALGRGLRGRRERLPQLAQLVLEVGERPSGVRILEPDRRRPALHLSGVQQGGQRPRQVVEDSLAALLPGFDPFPVLTHPPRSLRLDVTEDVRVPAHELGVHVPSDRLEVPIALLAKEQGEHVDLEEEVAELVEQLRWPVAERRLGNLVRLLDGVRNDGADRLLAVPRTLAPELLRQLLKREQRVG